MTNPLPRRSCHAVIPGDPAQACPKRARVGSPYCDAHTRTEQPHPEGARAFVQEWRGTAARALRNVIDRREHGGLEHDPDLVRALLPLAMPLYSKYWRVDTYGIDNIPADGPALLAANHSGTLPIDGAMLKVAILREHGRNPWLLAADLAFKIPGFSDLIRLAGNARADRDETIGLLRAGELLGVFPEGFKGIGKGFRKRYRLQRFGRGGFVEMCMLTGAPIIPVAIIGAEEAYPMVANLESLARRLGLPYFPVTPTWPLLGPLGLLPLPSKWIIAFGEPIPFVQYGPKAVRDTQLVLEQTDAVRQAVQALIDENLPKRRGAFS